MLSIAINVKNGARYLERCLNALVRFADVVVVDNFSTDLTVKIAQSFPNVRIFQHEFCGMGKLRNLAANYAIYDWVFVVDSDEVVSPELVNTLLNFSFAANHVYRILRNNFYANQHITTSGWGNDWVMRVYNRKCNQFNPDADVHESLMLTKTTVIQKIASGYIDHFPYTCVAQLIDKMQLYSTLYAQQHFRLQKKNPQLWVIPFKALAAFLKCYILQGGFRQGYAGFAISSYNAMGVFSKYIKLYEIQQQKQLSVHGNGADSCLW